MATRGVVSVITFYPEIYDSNTAPIVSYQNYFPETRTIFPSTVSSTYNAFSMSAFTEKGDTSGSDSFDITFAATAANVDFVETAIINRYSVQAFIVKWKSSINAPAQSQFFVTAARTGYAVSGVSDFTSVTLTVSEYNDSIDSDLPFRRIPWTILGPMSFRR